MTKLILSGASGKMGEAISRHLKSDRQYSLVASLQRGSPMPTAAADVWIDFSEPAATLSYLPYIAKNKIAMVIGTSGFTGDELATIAKTSQSAPLIHAANTSLGMNLLFSLAKSVSAKLGEEFDIDISEVHHRFKKDAPSGSALELGRQVEAGLGLKSKVPQWAENSGRQRDGYPRFQSTRSGAVIGEHTVRFGSLHEVIKLEHQALNRDVFAVGALKAAAWLVGKPAGHYTMLDVLGVK